MESPCPRMSIAAWTMRGAGEKTPACRQRLNMIVWRSQGDNVPSENSHGRSWMCFLWWVSFQFHFHRQTFQQWPTFTSQLKYPQGTPYWRIDLQNTLPLEKDYIGEFNLANHQIPPKVLKQSALGPTKLPNPVDFTLVWNGQDSVTAPQPSHIPQCWYPSQSSNLGESSCQTSLGEDREDRTIGPSSKKNLS